MLIFIFRSDALHGLQNDLATGTSTLSRSPNIADDEAALLQQRVLKTTREQGGEDMCMMKASGDSL